MYQKALEVQNSLHVLSLSLKPGFEDLAALTYLRRAHGAQIWSAYLTNGEASDHDERIEYPHERAATLRREAWQAISEIGGEVLFLNFPDFGVSEDTSFIRLFWPKDLLQQKLDGLLSKIRPDVILLNGDSEIGDSSVRWGIVLEDVLETVRNAQRSTQDNWKAAKVIAYEKAGMTFPVTNKDLFTSRPYLESARSASERYRSLRKHPVFRDGPSIAHYVVAFPTSKTRRGLDSGLSPNAPKTLRNRETGIKRLCSQIIDRTKTGRQFTEKQKTNLLKTIAAELDSIGVSIAQLLRRTAGERKLLLSWKSGLEDLRNTLLGAQLYHSLSEHILTDRQLTYLSIDSVRGFSKDGKSQIYFPGVGADGWILDEKWNQWSQLRIGEPYRLVSPDGLTYDLPESVYGLQTEEYGNTLWFLVIHESAQRERSFVMKAKERVRYAPKLSIEALTPILRVVDGEELRVRFTNHSRDGFADVANVNDSLVSSQGEWFRLSKKDTSAVITMKLKWGEDIGEGNHAFAFRLGEVDVGVFLARKFETKIDTSKRVGYLSTYESGILERSLQRLGIFARRCDVTDSDYSGLDVLFLDDRVLTLFSGPQPGTLKNRLLRFAENGGHLVIFRQDAGVWNGSPLLDELTLVETQALDAQSEFLIDSTHAFLSRPNKINDEAWVNWLDERSRQFVQVGETEGVESPIRSSKTRQPLLVTQRHGKGRITYSAITLSKQLLNIHPGAFRLLANLASY
ncbi:MAG: PIG-L family deacetylase [Ignavibacteriales bacterium]|nr:PIG-L family deacetylase [Ignavibacteriales bacterium]